MNCRLPIDCVLAITYRCNARCGMCDIWKIKDFVEVPLSEYAKLPSSLRDVNISGGETFLRADLVEVVRTVVKACPKARIVISSNGFSTGLIVQRMKDILKIKPDIGVAISIDGIGQMHDDLRGIPGAFEKCMATVKALQGLGMTNLRLAFTMMRLNTAHMSKVYDLAQELGVQFAHSFTQSSDFYFGGKDNADNTPRKDIMENEYNTLIKKELASWNVKRWLRAYFAHGMKNFALKRGMVLTPAPGRDFFFMDPSGDIFPSVIHNVIMANIRDVKSRKDFPKFWCSKKMETKRKQVDALKIPAWMICIVRSAIVRHPFRVGWWIFKNKFFA
ncbi:MAG: radical SAM protein [bacterium]|nr:radical SAM protein [bacterium]